MTNDGEEALMKAQRILVPLDGSALAEAALPKAIELLSDAPGAALVLLRAAEAVRLPGGDPTAAQVAVVQEAQSYLDALAAKLREQGVARVQTSVWYGRPAPAIVEAAEIGHVDLIVMSTHGRSGLGRLILGSVAESVLRGTRTPILLLRAGYAPIETPAGTAAPRPTKEEAHV
ncbi:MAG: universal stress protein [Candidatus Rokubacteria bacterium]|nr:universal stress protein [Candidatus Rokubacteria bacterium]